MLTKKILFGLILSGTVTMTSAQRVTTTINDLKMSPSFRVSIQPDAKPATFLLVVENPSKKTLHLSITNKDLGAVVDTVIISDEFKSRFNFDQVMDGRYTVVIESGKEKFLKEIELSTVTTRRMDLN